MSVFPDDAIEPDRAIAVARAAAAISTVTLLVLAAATELVSGQPRFEGLALPAGLVGLVSPVIGRHLYELVRQREPGASQGAAVFLKANIAALAVTEGAALFGLVAFVFSGRIVALTGLLMHVILTGALWPTRERLDNFLDGAS